MNCNNCGADTKGETICGTCGFSVTVDNKSSSNSKNSTRNSASLKSKGIKTAFAQDTNLPIQNSFEDHFKKYKLGLIVSYVLVALLLISGLVYVSQTEKKISELESELSYQDSSISNLEFEISHLGDWGYDELDSVVTCVNNFIDSWAERIPAYYCLYPSAP